MEEHDLMHSAPLFSAQVLTSKRAFCCRQILLGLRQRHVETLKWCPAESADTSALPSNFFAAPADAPAAAAATANDDDIDMIE